MLINECRNELANHIIPFWNNLRDNEFGGFYGQMDNDLKVDKKGGKGKDAKPRGGAFAIVQKLLAYPVEKKSSADNVEFISELKELAAELL